MASTKPSWYVSVLLWAVLVVVLLSAKTLHGQEPELTSDFFVPVGLNASNIDSSYFTFTGFREGAVSANNASNDDLFSVTTATRSNLASLTGLGVSVARLVFGPGALNPPHLHPRGTELMYILQGTLTVGLVDSTNKLYNQTLQQGDLFVFPEGMPHFQSNEDGSSSSLAIVAFSCSNPGTHVLAPSLFKSGISDSILEQSFNTSAVIIDEIETEFGTANVSSSAPSFKT